MLLEQRLEGGREMLRHGRRRNEQRERGSSAGYVSSHRLEAEQERSRWDADGFELHVQPSASCKESNDDRACWRLELEQNNGDVTCFNILGGDIWIVSISIALRRAFSIHE